jgi:hypothetical protein
LVGGRWEIDRELFDNGFDGQEERKRLIVEGDKFVFQVEIPGS